MSKSDANKQAAMQQQATQPANKEKTATSPGQNKRPENKPSDPVGKKPVAADTADSKARQKGKTGAKTPSSGKSGSGSLLLWLIALLALFAALAAGWYSYSLQQQQTNASQASRELFLDRINQLEREQQRIIAQNQEAQGQLGEKIDQNLVTIRNQFSRLPTQISKQLLVQLVTQAELLHLAQAPGEQVILLLEEALRVARLTDQPGYNNLARALESDLGVFKQHSGQDLDRKLAELEDLRSTIRNLDFSPLARQEDIPETTQQNTTTSDQETGALEQAFQAVNNLFGELVIVRKHQQAISVDLSMDQFNSIKLLVESALSQAQITLLLGNQDSYKDALMQAASYLDNYLSSYDLGSVSSRLGALAGDGIPETLTLSSGQALSALQE